MKKILNYMLGAVTLSFALIGCYDDEGNYAYFAKDQLSVIEIDTTTVEGLKSVNRFAFTGSYSTGDTVQMSPRVNYVRPENLTYSWIIYSYPYTAVPEVNAWVYTRLSVFLIVRHTKQFH